MKYIPKSKQGGTIHIKPENKGKFTATKKATGKTTEELTHSKNPITKKRAIFAQNAKKWKHQNGGLLYPKVNQLINRTNQKNIDFVNRLKDPKRKFITNWENPKEIATHKMSWATDDKGATIYPNVQNIKGKLIDFTRPPYNKWAGYNSAIQNNDTIQTTPEIAQEYTTNYKKFYPQYTKHQTGGLLERKDVPFIIPKPIQPEFPYNGQSMYKGGYNLKRALELYKPGEFKSVDYTNGEWLKDKDHPTAWKELIQTTLNLNLNKQVGFPILNENGRLQYTKHQNGGVLKLQSAWAPLIQRPDNTSVQVKEKLSSIPASKEYLFNIRNFGQATAPTNQTTLQPKTLESSASKKFAQSKIENRERVAKLALEQAKQKELERKAIVPIGMGVSTLLAPLPTILGSIGGEGLNIASKKLTGKTWGENVLPKAPILGEFTNPGALLGGINGIMGTNFKRKVGEIALRSGDFEFEKIGRALRHPSTYEFMLTHNPSVLKRAASKYSLSEHRPHYYSGMIKYSFEDPFKEGTLDLVDVYLGRSGNFPLREIKTKDFGVHNNYIKENYADKIDKIRTFSVNSSDIPKVTKSGDFYKGISKLDGEPSVTVGATGSIVGDLGRVDAAGHLRSYKRLSPTQILSEQQDIWKFNPRDYVNRYSGRHPNTKSLLGKWGLKLLDDIGNPVIIKKSEILTPDID